MKCSMTGFVVSDKLYDFAGGKGVKLFFEETFEANGREHKQRIPVKIWHSTHGHDLSVFRKGAYMTLHGFMDFRRYRKGGEGKWLDDIAFDLIKFEVLEYKKKGEEDDGGF